MRLPLLKLMRLYMSMSFCRNCMVNPVALLMLTCLHKYVRLWGPLCTHSPFGFESKNGHLKYSFHGKSDIMHQLLFNIDVSHTLQYMHSRLLEHETEETMSYIDHLYHLKRKSNMVCIGSHLYVVGHSQCKAVQPTIK